MIGISSCETVMTSDARSPCVRAVNPRPPRYWKPRVTIRRFALMFALFELCMFLMSFLPGADVLYGVFLISLLIVPIMVFPWVLQANTDPRDEEFESPGVWFALAVLGGLAFLVLCAVGALVMIQGDWGNALYFFSAAAVVLAFSMMMMRSARRRRREWASMMRARKLRCPACGKRGPHELDLCLKCGAVVFWMPTWRD